MNPTHQLYQTLSRRDRLPALEAFVLTFPAEEAQARLQPLFTADPLLALGQGLDYPRLYALLRRDFTGWNLQGEDFQNMRLRDFVFEGADCTNANFRAANLIGCDFIGACLQQASCQGVIAIRAQLDNAHLMESDWSCAALIDASLHNAEATDATFRDAIMNHADLSRACLRRADCFRAECCYSNLAGADLREANFQGTELSWSDLRGANLAGTNLRASVCSPISFDPTWQVNAATTIDPQNHVLIGMVLLSQAHTIEQQQFALYVQFQTALCWPGFLKLLLRQPRHMMTWAKEALRTIRSLRPMVDYLEGEYEQMLRAHQPPPLEMSQIPSALRALLHSEQEQQAILTPMERYWYLRGVLAAACRQLEMHLDEEQQKQLLGPLRQALQETDMDNDLW